MIAFLKETLRSKRTLFISATGMTVVLKVSTLIPALLLGGIIDTLSSGSLTQATDTVLFLIMLCIATVLQAVFNPLQTYKLVSLVQTILKEKSAQWTDAILRKEFEAFSSQRLGGLIKSLERGIAAHEKFLSFIITSGLPLIIEVVLIAAIFSYAGGTGILLTLLGVSIAYVLLYRQLVNWRRPFLLAVNHQEDTVSAKLFETFRAGKTIKLEQACEEAPRPLYESYDAYAKAATKVASTGAILGSIRILYLGLSTACLLAWGVHDQLTLSPQLTIGELVAIVSIAGVFLNNVSALSEAYRSLDQFIVDREVLHKLLSLDDLIDCPQTAALGRIHSLCLSNDRYVNDTPLCFRCDESVAIIGPSGGGKTTLLETLCAINKPARKQLLVNHDCLRPTDLDHFMGRVRYCPQNPVFLEGPIDQSVVFGQEISPAMVGAVEALALKDLAENRCIAESANNISGGEAKRLSLLRQINRPGDFNLFDEPTSSLDPDMTARVWNTLFSHFRYKGFICVTHDFSALPLFDRVLVIEQGSVIADGPWHDVKNDETLVKIIKEAV